MACPRVVIAGFLALGVAGFATMPLLKISTDLLAGVGETNPTIRLTKQNDHFFGEQDALIVVLEFPEPPGEARLAFIKGIGKAIEGVEGVRRVRYQFVDPDDKEYVTMLFKQFILGMNDKERETFRHVVSAQGAAESLRRNVNRLFLVEDPYLETKILEDPLELAQFVARSMEQRVGSLSLGDPHFLIASPDSTMYLIQVTPQFPSHDMARGKELADRIRAVIPEEISRLTKEMPGKVFREVTWSLTGKIVFHQESDVIFDQESSKVVLCSFGLVLGFLLYAYRSLWSALILLTPIVAAIGPSYGVMWLSYDEINPVVMAATGLLIGMGAEYGEHMWGRFREEIDKGVPHTDAVRKACEGTGPPVLLGALTGILAFLCLCMSTQPALIQFGVFGATGLALTAVTTLFLFPALVMVFTGRKKDYFPGIRLSFWGLARWFEMAPKGIVIFSTVLTAMSIGLATRISYEKDLFKVFLAKNMDSMSVSDRISRKFRANFTKPVHLSFDVDDLQQGLKVQRELDDILEDLMQRDNEIAAFDSISYLMAPDSVKTKNRKACADASASWGELERAFGKELAQSPLSVKSSSVIGASLGELGQALAELGSGSAKDMRSPLLELERSWYLAPIEGSHRFLTHIRYTSDITDPEAMKAADNKILQAVEGLPVKVHISGTRRVMETILESLVSELVRLGVYGFLAVVVVFFVVFPSIKGVGLCLVPMVGAFCLTLGVLGAIRMGVPFSIVCVAPLIFGFGIHNSMHVVMGSMEEQGGSVAKATARVTPRAMVTSLTVVMGFVSMLTSHHYSMVFLGCAMITGMLASVPLTLVTLPALLVVLENRRALERRN
ncbi:MAG: MMPL family transporter [Thermodesulfobacteriota bacterium]